MSEKSMLEAVKNCLIRRPKVRMIFGLASNNVIYLLSTKRSMCGMFRQCLDLGSILQR